MSETHWKKAFNPEYLGAYSLEPGRDIVVTIDKIEKRNVKNTDGKEEECLVAVLRGEKPFILNKTNCKTIAKVLGSPYIEQWVGKSILIGIDRVRAFGETVEALRVRQKPAPTNDEAKKAELRQRIREALATYTGEDVADIRAKLNAAKQAKQDSAEFLLSILHKLVQ